jgi:hypothetical protein
MSHPYSTFTDINVFHKFKELIEKHDIKTIFETGTHGGISSKILSHYVDKVVTVDVRRFERASDRLSDISNVYYHIDDSAKAIKDLVKDGEQNIIFFLDAHTGETSRILDELDEIAKKNIKPVIVAHDFEVPNNKSFTYDKPLTLNQVKSNLDKVYGLNGYVYEYSAEFKFHNPFIYLDIYDEWETRHGNYIPERHKTAPGVIYIEPKEL